MKSYKRETLQCVTLMRGVIKTMDDLDQKEQVYVTSLNIILKMLEEAITNGYTNHPEGLYYGLNQMWLIFEADETKKYIQMRVLFDILKIIMDGFVTSNIDGLMRRSGYEHLLKNQIYPEDIKKEIKEVTEKGYDDNSLPWEKYRVLRVCADAIKQYDMSKEEIKEIRETLIQEYYQKKGYPTPNGYHKIIAALEKFDVPDDILETIKIELPKCIKEEKMPKSFAVIHKPVSLKLGLNNEEYHEIKRKVKTYYDLKNHLPIKMLDINEKIELATLLKWLEVDDMEIKQILKQIETLYPSSITSPNKNIIQNGFNIYTLWKKIMDSEEDSQKEELIDIIQELRHCKNEEERTIWRQMLWDILLQNYEMKAKKCDYEVQVATRKMTLKQ